MSDGEQQLNECGCCEGVEKLTPASVENLPGLSALAYRVGTHGTFKTTMQASLSGEATRCPVRPAKARIAAGTNAAHLETAIELYICAMGFVVMTQIGQFDKVLVQIYGLFAA